MSYTYNYPRPALTVDAVIFGLDPSALKVLLVQRASEPYKGKWAFPGGFVDMDETAEQAVARELEEETGAAEIPFEQLQAFSAIDRDPRGRVVSIAYFGLVAPSAIQAAAASDAQDARWLPVDPHPALAFDHEEILSVATQELRRKVQREPIGLHLLPKAFTLGDLHQLYQNALQKPIDKQNLSRQIKKLDILKDLERQRNGAALYAFDGRRFQQLQKAGINLEL